MAEEKFDVSYLLQPQTIINALNTAEPERFFLRDRYAPRTLDQQFSTPTVLVEIKDGDRDIAPFVLESADGVVFDRGGYRVHEYRPATIAVGRVLTLDDLKHRQFGEVAFANVAPEQRAAQIIAEDALDLRAKIDRREEKSTAEVLINNAFVFQETIDGKTPAGPVKKFHFYNNEDPANAEKSPATLTLTKSWDTTKEGGKQILSDLGTMISMLAEHNRIATDLLVSPDVYDILYHNEYLHDLFDNRRIEIGGISPEQFAQYPGVHILGPLNVKGTLLNIICYEGAYVDDEGKRTPYLPEGTAIVTAPAIMGFKYGSITQMENDEQWHTYYAPVVPRVFADVKNSMRELEMRSRSIPVPQYYCPAIYAKVTGVE